MEKKVTSHFVKALIISLGLFILGLIANFGGFEYETWYRWLPTLLLIAAIIWACINYANQMNNAVTFGNVFGHGFKVTAVVAILTMVLALISVFVIFPDTKEKALELTRQEMEKTNRSDSEIDTAMEMGKKFFLVGLVGTIVIGTLIIGCIASLLGAAFAKKNPPSPFNNPNV